MVKIIEPKIITDELKPDGSYGRFICGAAGQRIWYYLGQ